MMTSLVVVDVKRDPGAWGGVSRVRGGPRSRERVPACVCVPRELCETRAGTRRVDRPGCGGGTGVAGADSRVHEPRPRGAGPGRPEFFPAEASGGRDFLSAVAGPLPDILFCPTGGISPANAEPYPALPNVGCVGGSWLTPGEAVAAGDWDRIQVLAEQAAGLRITA